jgi:hypothetical protein
MFLLFIGKLVGSYIHITTQFQILIRFQHFPLYKLKSLNVFPDGGKAYFKVFRGCADFIIYEL